MSGLAGKRFWLVGASAGIGRQLALRLAQEGVAVAASARDGAALAKLIDEMAPVRTAMGGHVAVRLDVTDSAGAIAAFENVGEVDGVIYCAGAYEPMSARRPHLGVLETIVDVNLGAGLFRLWERLRHCLNANSCKGSRRNIAHHYDLGNAFYGLWLDETMTYSSALFRSGRESLADAQQNKYAAICDRLAPAPGDRVLEIGCGWGGFAEYAIRERGVRVTGLTISREQHDYARRRLFEAGLAERAEIVLRDYREERGTYDAIASIEMIEAVGEKYWPVYFSTLHERLRPNGVAALQAITISDRLFPQYRTSADFLQKYIFPGGMLPSPAALHDRSAAAGLKTIGTEAFADSYSRTLRTWRHQFNARWDRIAALGFDDRFRRMWNFYLAASAAGFASGATDVVQIAYSRDA